MFRSRRLNADQSGTLIAAHDIKVITTVYFRKAITVILITNQTENISIAFILINEVSL